MEQTQKLWPINQLFVFLASMLVVIIILKYASDILVPFLLSIAIAMILHPLLSYFVKLHTPKVVALVLILLASLIPIIILSDTIATEVSSLVRNTQDISSNFTHAVERSTTYAKTFGITIDENIINNTLEKSNISDLLKQLASQISNQFSNIFLIYFTAAFMLMEAEFFYNKMIKIAQKNNRDTRAWMLIVAKIKSYFMIKVKTSLLTALWALAVLWYYDVSYLYLWVTLVFFLNFIPVIGSIIAAVPAIIMAGIDHGIMSAVWVGSWYAIINMIVGNIIEPRIMGKGLGLSALIVFLSMTFWGWVFGPAGMILSVPLTMVIQFMFAQYDETRWVSLLLSDYEREKE